MLLEWTAVLMVISIALTRDLRDWETLVGPLGTLGWLASVEVVTLSPVTVLYCTVLF
jgi:hypothetical protein